MVAILGDYKSGLWHAVHVLNSYEHGNLDEERILRPGGSSLIRHGCTYWTHLRITVIGCETTLELLPLTRSAYIVRTNLSSQRPYNCLQLFTIHDAVRIEMRLQNG